MIFVYVYVDDVLITSSDPQMLSDLISQLHSQFALKYLDGISYFLMIEMSCGSIGLHFCQHRYILDLLDKCGTSSYKPFDTPLSSGSILTKLTSTPFENPTQFQSLVGVLQYCCLTCPDVTFMVNKFCQFLSYPTDAHWVVLNALLDISKVLSFWPSYFNFLFP